MVGGGWNKEEGKMYTRGIILQGMLGFEECERVLKEMEHVEDGRVGRDETSTHHAPPSDARQKGKMERVELDQSRMESFRGTSTRVLQTVVCERVDLDERQQEPRAARGRQRRLSPLPACRLPLHMPPLRRALHHLPAGLPRQRRIARQHLAHLHAPLGALRQPRQRDPAARLPRQRPPQRPAPPAPAARACSPPAAPPPAPSPPPGTATARSPPGTAAGTPAAAPDTAPQPPRPAPPPPAALRAAVSGSARPGSRRLPPASPRSSHDRTSARTSKRSRRGSCAARRRRRTAAAARCCLRSLACTRASAPSDRPCLACPASPARGSPSSPAATRRRTDSPAPRPTPPPPPSSLPSPRRAPGAGSWLLTAAAPPPPLGVRRATKTYRDCDSARRRRAPCTRDCPVHPATPFRAKAAPSRQRHPPLQTAASVS